MKFGPHIENTMGNFFQQYICDIFVDWLLVPGPFQESVSYNDISFRSGCYLYSYYFHQNA